MSHKLHVQEWLNTDESFSIDDCQGSLVLVFAFQMLCPGCVLNTIPQSKKIDQMFSGKNLQVIGLHTVFEHHEAMKKESLKAFMHEYQIRFPVAIDLPGESSPIPKTMEKYQMQGTPTTLLFDQKGELRLQRFGHIDDLEIGTIIGSLL